MKQLVSVRDFKISNITPSNRLVSYSWNSISSMATSTNSPTSTKPTTMNSSQTTNRLMLWLCQHITSIIRYIKFIFRWWFRVIGAMTNVILLFVLLSTSLSLLFAEFWKKRNMNINRGQAAFILYVSNSLDKVNTFCISSIKRGWRVNTFANTWHHTRRKASSYITYHCFISNSLNIFVIHKQHYYSFTRFILFFWKFISGIRFVIFIFRLQHMLENFI